MKSFQNQADGSQFFFGKRTFYQGDVFSLCCTLLWRSPGTMSGAHGSDHWTFTATNVCDKSSELYWLEWSVCLRLGAAIHCHSLKMSCCANDDLEVGAVCFSELVTHSLISSISPNFRNDPKGFSVMTLHVDKEAICGVIHADMRRPDENSQVFAAKHFQIVPVSCCMHASEEVIILWLWKRWGRSTKTRILHRLCWIHWELTRSQLYCSVSKYFLFFHRQMLHFRNSSARNIVIRRASPCSTCVLGATITLPR